MPVNKTIIMRRIITLIFAFVLVMGMSFCKHDVSFQALKDNSGKKLAVIFPGAGYNKDRPLLYYSREILEKEGYEIINIEWEDYVKTRYDQASEVLDNIDFEEYDDIVFVCKSIGTEVSSTYYVDYI
ncbi:MAG: hypothetical protein K5665_00355 [Saccharofermentans sp.]|nr:hypothetical protein [Saccharofermentans sp.]